MADLLQTRDLSRSFGGLTAVDSVSLSVAEGETHALIGPNGAGKTTLISLLCGDIRPNSGTIRFAGADITRQPAYRRAHMGLARSYQITSVLKSFSVLDNVATAVQAVSGSSLAFWRPVRREAGLNDRAMALLDQVSLADRAHEPAGSLSHGEKRQLEVAMALASSPRVILLDEPMAGMGTDESARMVEFLATLKQSVTMLLVEHDMAAVFALADRISVLQNGSLLITGAPDAVRADAAVRTAYFGD